MAKTKDYLFSTTGGWAQEGRGTTPTRAYCDAKKRLSEEKPKFSADSKIQIGDLTTRYGVFGEGGFIQTGSFPHKLKSFPRCRR